MPTKKLRVDIKQGAGFRTECYAGEHTVIIDQPVAGGGTDEGPSPLYYQLIALGGCVAAIGRIVANQRRLSIRGIEVVVEGQIDTNRLLGKPSPNRVGYDAITVRVKIDADLTPAEKEKLLHEIDERCPISDNLQNHTTVNVVLAG